VPESRAVCGMMLSVLPALNWQMETTAASSGSTLRATADHADDAGPAEAGDHLVAAEGLELFGDGSRRAMDVEQELGVGMDVAPPGGDLAMQVGNAVHNRHLLSPRMTPIPP
jgi:hypothetical protein